MIFETTKNVLTVLAGCIRLFLSNPFFIILIILGAIPLIVNWIGKRR